MKVGDGVRHQLVTCEQQDFFDYWQGLCDRLGRLPSRSDIDPVRVHTHLPFVSLYSQDADGRFRVRLAGTGFWNFYGSEITGRRVDDLPLPADSCLYWHRVLRNVSSTHLPMAGTAAPGTPRGAHLRQFWLRLPLAPDAGNGVGGGVCDDDMLILGYDQFLEGPARKPSALTRSTFGSGAPLRVMA